MSEAGRQASTHCTDVQLLVALPSVRNAGLEAWLPVKSKAMSIRLSKHACTKQRWCTRHTPTTWLLMRNHNLPTPPLLVFSPTILSGTEAQLLLRPLPPLACMHV
eukprot:scaffold241725_cov22-Tisochrysis_lutea.AAC.1